MEFNETQKNLIFIYGNNVFEDILKEINELKSNSNIPFDQKYIGLGLSFCAIKAKQIINGERGKCSLQSLVSESFGEAEIYRSNICGGEL